MVSGSSDQVAVKINLLPFTANHHHRVKSTIKSTSDHGALIDSKSRPKHVRVSTIMFLQIISRKKGKLFFDSSSKGATTDGNVGLR
jgi:hypothetical protein